MADPSVSHPGLMLKAGAGATEEVRELQRNLRALGYLKSGIDGVFGTSTTLAVKALQYDLLWNHGKSAFGDGAAPVAVADYNHGHVGQVTGIVDKGTASCIAAMVTDVAFPKLPFSADAVADNDKVAGTIASLPPTTVPIPFLLAILKQESGLQHFRIPAAQDEDSFIFIGLDTNASEKHIITSRGYGIGQYTLFHHPPRPEEVSDMMLNPESNIRKASSELRGKFDHFVNGPSSGTTAEDRVAEYGKGRLRLCRYEPTDSRYMRDCRSCMQSAGLVQIQQGDALYPGSGLKLEPTQYYQITKYVDVPDRKSIGCDWPYAVRRYNGAGVNSYHYQIRVLQFVLASTTPLIAASKVTTQGSAEVPPSDSEATQT